MTLESGLVVSDRYTCPTAQGSVSRIDISALSALSVTKSSKDTESVDSLESSKMMALVTELEVCHKGDDTTRSFHQVKQVS